jgi:MFS family permease
MIFLYMAWPKPNQLRRAELRPLREQDFVGSVILIAASVLFVFSFQEGGLTADAWTSALFLAPLIVGSVCWILLFGWEITVSLLWEHSIQAILPLRLFKRRIYVASIIVTMLVGFPYFLVIYSLPIRFQVVNEETPLAAGVGLLPMLGSAAVAAMLGGLISGKKDRTWVGLILGASLMAIGAGLLSTLSNTIDVEAKTYGAQVFLGLGFGLTVSSAIVTAVLQSEIRDSGESS